MGMSSPRDASRPVSRAISVPSPGITPGSLSPPMSNGSPRIPQRSSSSMAFPWSPRTIFIDLQRETPDEYALGQQLPAAQAIRRDMSPEVQPSWPLSPEVQPSWPRTPIQNPQSEKNPRVGRQFHVKMPLRREQSPVSSARQISRSFSARQMSPRPFSSARQSRTSNLRARTNGASVDAPSR
eukprot:gnl/MRDRNA2_/MRDRNA2_66031_c1_seq2.p1 gnl/MRDRNA2_/MRDRNA2_66031_c1~~gnl/MRDRNA2_/MRDRNA2_66031_c1_seq2.p1  ORF type:complete len:182 (+),score=15.90 gnl/MRDRNA2_/MRDRNA2_66031_c1_seq2:208-753(+)